MASSSIPFMSTQPSGAGSATPVTMPSMPRPESASTISPATMWRSIMADSNDSRHTVGYKKPPRHTQFKPGQSGNVKGRPKGAKNFATVFQEELCVPIEVTENGKRKRISKRQAIAKQHINKAVAGDPKAAAIVLNEVRPHESPNQPPTPQMVMNSIGQRYRQSSPPPLDPGSPPDPPSEDQPSPPSQSDKGE